MKLQCAFADAHEPKIWLESSFAHKRMKRKIAISKEMILKRNVENKKIIFQSIFISKIA